MGIYLSSQSLQTEKISKVHTNSQPSIQPWRHRKHTTPLPSLRRRVFWTAQSVEKAVIVEDRKKEFQLNHTSN